MRLSGGAGPDASCGSAGGGGLALVGVFLATARPLNWRSGSNGSPRPATSSIVPLNTLEARLAELSAAGHTIPTVIQQRRLAKRLQAQLSRLPGTDIKRAASDVVRSLNPFEQRDAGPEPLAQMADGGSTTAGSSTSPTPTAARGEVSVGRLRLSLNAKLTLLRKVLTYDAVGYLVTGGEDSADILYDICAALEASSKASVNELQDVPAMVGRLPAQRSRVPWVWSPTALRLSRCGPRRRPTATPS